MDYSQHSDKTVKLSELLDLALGTPDPGSVNFGILYIILSHIIKHLKIGDVEPDVEKPSNEPQSRNDAKISTSDLTPNIFHNIQKRLTTIESQLTLLNSLPNNEDIISLINKDNNNKKNNHSLDTLNDDYRIVTNLWQTVQTNKRLDATEEGLHRLSSLTDDLLGQIKRFSEQNKALKSALEEALLNSALKDQLAELTRKLGEIEKRQNQQATLLQNVVHMDALRGLVFWHTLGKSITGVDYLTAYSQVNTTNNKTYHVNNIDNNNLIKDESNCLTKSLPEEFLECPDPDLSSTLRKLGNVASGFDSVVNRIEQLEALIKQKPDRNELEGLGVPTELYEKIYSLEAIVKELAKEREKIYVDCGTSPHMPYPSDDKKLLKKLQNTMSVLQEQINQLNNIVTNVQSQFKKLHETVEDVKQYADDLETRKADANYVDTQLDKKADREDVKGFINRLEFDNTNQALEKLIEDLFAKLTLAENELKSLLTDLQETMETKLDRDEMEQLREWLEKRFKSINKRLNSFSHDTSPTRQITDEAAGLKRSLMQHYHCISCDRPLEVALSQEYLGSYPTDNRGFPMNKSIRPYTTFDLESLRHQIQTRSNKAFYIDPPYKRSNCNYYDVYGGTPRQCGGTHTTAPSSKRKSRATTCKSSLHDGDVTTKSSIPYSYRETLNLQGMDGHIYRGSPIQENQHLLNNNDLSTGKDEENLDKDSDRNEKLPPVSKSSRYVNTVTARPQVTYKYNNIEKRDKSQSPQYRKYNQSDELQYKQSNLNNIEHLPQLMIGSTQLPNQRQRKYQLNQINNKLINEHLSVKTNGYAVIVVPNTGTIEQETPELKTENGWIAEKLNNELNENSSPTGKEKHSSTYPSPATNDNDEGEVELELVTRGQSSPDVNITVDEISN
uniref:Glutamine-rich protein n=1 Tax=Schistosoma mansoni TaxID=6183 RepID=A0A3Q0KNS5_SCHMA